MRSLNPDYDWEQAKAGDEVTVPNVAEHFDPAAAGKNKEDTAKSAETKADATKSEDASTSLAIEVNTAAKMLDLKQDGKLVATYPITPGSDQLPAPKGEWKIVGTAWMPDFRWDKKMLEEGERSDDFYKLPPGPNSPVGIVWMELNSEGIGIHGTGEPDTIGRSASQVACGCPTGRARSRPAGEAGHACEHPVGRADGVLPHPEIPGARWKLFIPRRSDRCSRRGTLSSSNETSGFSGHPADLCRHSRSG